MADAKEIFISKFSAWAPGVENSDEWNEWALGKRNIKISSGSPSLDFTEPNFRRRLSQISKMTIQVVHDLLPASENAKIIFLSFRGELLRQFKVNKMLVEENSLLPATFSFSGSNTPVAFASIAFGLKGGYSAIYPVDNTITTGLLLAEAAFNDTQTQELIFIYADEEVPPEYIDVFSGENIPLAFALLLTRNSRELSIPFSSLLTETANKPDDFLKRLILLKNRQALSQPF